MSHKRVVIKGGKTYGPYLYESYRDEYGKVKKRYLGRASDSANRDVEQKPKRNFFAILGILFLVCLFVFFMGLPFTGKAILSVESIHSNGSILSGDLLFVLQQSELIPADTQVIINHAGNSYEYSLKDLIEEEEIQGEFYLDNIALEGNGSGFGLSMSRFPPVSFVLGIYQEINESNETRGLSGQTILNFITGRTSLELVEEINGEVSANNLFVYDLEAGQVAEIISSSEDVNLVTENNQVIVSTDYLGDASEEFAISLDELNIPAENGLLEVSLIYNGEQLLDGSIYISVQEGIRTLPEEIIVSEIPVVNESENETELLNETREPMASCGGATPCNCGDSLTSSWNMTGNLSCTSGWALRIEASNVVLDCKGYTLGDGDCDAGVYSFGAYSNVVIKNCNIHCNDSSSSSIAVTSASTNNLYVYNNSLNGGYNGVAVGGSNLRIERNTIYNTQSNGAAISLGSSSNVSIKDNTIYNCSYKGIHLAGNNVSILNNYFDSCNYAGISSGNSVVNNTIANNTFIVDGGDSQGSLGIYLESVSSSIAFRIYNNTFNLTGSDASVDIAISLSSYNKTEIYSNKIYGFSGTGDYPFSFSSSYNHTISNNYVNSTKRANIVGGGNLYWNSTYNCTFGPNIAGGRCMGGNYWNGSSVADSNNDSIGDVNYTSGSMIDYLPLNRTSGRLCAYNLTNNYTLIDEVDCNGNGIKIGASDLIFNCDGNSIAGDGSGNGIYTAAASLAHRGIIKNCNIVNFADAISFDSSDNWTVYNNTLVNSDFGIALVNMNEYFNISKNFLNVSQYGLWFPGGGNYNLIENNTIFLNLIGNNYGSAISFPVNGSYNQILHNTIYGGNNSDGSDRGIYWVGNTSVYNLIHGNNISNHYNAIYLNSVSSMISHTNITSNIINNSNRYAIHIANYINGTLIYDNYIGNSTGANAFEGTTSHSDWNTTYSCGTTNIMGMNCTGGNYWSDYNGQDSDGDGIGNYYVPWNSSRVGANLSGAMQDYLPLTKNFSSSSYTLFGGSTTNFNNHATPYNISNAVIENATRGKIKWLGSVNAVGQDFDANIQIGDGFVSLNSSGLRQVFNSSANITLYNVGCRSNSQVYYKDGTFSNADDIRFSGTDCVSAGICSNVLCVGGQNMTFTVSHFTGFATGANTNLTIWDETDSGMPYGGQTKYVGEDVRLFANYTNSTGAIDSANCTINFTDSTDNVMDWNSSDGGFYQYNRSFASSGNQTFNVSCNKTGYDSLNASDNVSITVAASVGVQLYNPITATNFNRNGMNEFTINVTCLSGACGTVNVTLDPETLNFYDILGISGGGDGTRDVMAECSGNNVATCSSYSYDSYGCTSTVQYSASVYYQCAYNFDTDSCSMGSSCILPTCTDSGRTYAATCASLYYNQPPFVTCSDYYSLTTGTYYICTPNDMSNSCKNGLTCSVPVASNMTNAPSGTNFTNSTGGIINSSIDAFYLKSNSSGIIFARFNLIGNVNLTGASANSTGSKSFFHFGAASKTNLSYVRLQINKTIGNGVVICPSATSLDSINGSCTNAILLSSTNSSYGGYTLTSDASYWYVQANATNFSTGIQQLIKDGIIPMNSGTPFYTNVSNPYTTSSLSGGQSELVTWYVNATGEVLGQYEFFAFVNLTSNMSVSNSTNRVNITIMNPLDGLCESCYDCMYELNNYAGMINLTQSISESGTCIYNLTADNKILNCNGFNITGNTSGIGINASNIGNFTVKNCNISRFDEGIRLTNVSNGTIYNSSLISNNLTGFVSFQSNYTNFTLNNVTGSNVSGVNATSSHFGTYNDNIIYLNNVAFENYGIYLNSSNYSSFERNQIYDQYYSIYSRYSSNLSFISNNFTASTGGIYFLNSVGGHLIYNNNLTTFGDAIDFINSGGSYSNISYNRMSGNGITSSGSGNIQNLSITYNNFSVTGTSVYGIILSVALEYLDIKNNLINGSTSAPERAISIGSSSNSSISNNTIISFKKGIFASGGSYSNVEFNYNNISNVGDGIYLSGAPASNVNIRNNNFSYKSGYGSGANGRGIEVNANNVSVLNNKANGFITGIYYYSNNLEGTVSGNNLTNSTIISLDIVNSYCGGSAIDLTNVGGDDGKTIFYWNGSAASVSNAEYSEIILVCANNSVIDNVTINNSLTTSDGIYIRNSSGVVIKNSYLYKDYIGIDARTSDNLSILNSEINLPETRGIYYAPTSSNNSGLIQNNTIRNTTSYAIETTTSGANLIINNNSISNSSATAIEIGVSNSTVSNNSIYNCYEGMDIFRDNITISLNNITKTTDGIITSYSGDIFGNRINQSTRYGIYLYGGSSNVSNNNITNTPYGIHFETSAASNNIFDNFIRNSTTIAVYLSSTSSDNNNITGNTILNSTNGINITSGATGNRIYDNYFYNNTNDAYDAAAVNTNFWNTTLDCEGESIVGGCMGGNSWTSYYDNRSLTDRTGDGIGDDGLPVNNISYARIKGNVKDYLPLRVIRCGDLILNDTTISDVNDLLNCNSNGLNVSRSNLTLNCDNQLINSSGLYYGIYVNNSNNVSLRNCNIMNFSTAIYVDNSDNVTLFHNILRNNTLGVNVSAGSDNGLFYYNYLDNIGNKNAYDLGSNKWNNSRIGNFWSNYDLENNYNKTPRDDYNVSVYAGTPIAGQTGPKTYNLDYEPHPLSQFYDTLFDCGGIIDADYNNKVITLIGDLQCNGEDGIIFDFISKGSINNITLDCDGRSLTGTRTGYGIKAAGSGEAGRAFTNSIIRDCIIDNFNTGIFLRSHAYAKYECTVGGCNTDEEGQTIHGLSIENNIIRNNIYGLYMVSDEDFQREQSTCTWKYCDSACTAADIYSNNITGNNILNNTAGIFMTNSPDEDDAGCSDSERNANVKGNILRDNIVFSDYGIPNGIILTRTESSGEYPKDNYIFNNLFNTTNNSWALTSPQINYWNTTYNCSELSIVGGQCLGGNYWSDYAGLDDGSGVYPWNISGDYIGDTQIPYNNSGSMSDGDWLPLLQDNFVPAMTIVKVNATSVNNLTNDNLTCWANATDADGDLLNYTGFWYVNGIQNESITANGSYTSGVLVNVSTLDSSLTSVGDNWSCNVSAFDGTDSSSYLMSNNITILGFAVSNIECEINSVDNWLNCADLVYFDNITGVRAKCGDFGDNATFNLTNLYDNDNFFIDTTSNFVSGYFTLDNADVQILDSGNWSLDVTCEEAGISPEYNSTTFNILFGTLSTAVMVNPSSEINVTQNEFFNVTTSITCVDGECVNITATLDPQEIGADEVIVEESEQSSLIERIFGAITGFFTRDASEDGTRSISYKYCTCDSCTSCKGAFNYTNNCTEVVVTADFYDSSVGGHCVEVYSWLVGENLIFDCDGHTITGAGRDGGVGSAIYGSYGGGNVEIKNCNITNKTIGISFNYLDIGNIHNNNISNVNFGIKAYSGVQSGTIIANNTIRGITSGIYYYAFSVPWNYISGGAEGITFRDNYVYASSARDVIDETPTPAYNASWIGNNWTGNYWQGYTGCDSNADGHGDTELPFTVDLFYNGTNYDYYPLTDEACPVCGNGIPEAGESCDDGGTVDDCTCLADCSSPFCGDGLICGGESCEGINLGGEDCISQGFDSGTLACSACGFDTSGCSMNSTGISYLVTDITPADIILVPENVTNITDILDDDSREILLPFSFSFYDIIYNSVWFNSNGWIYVGNDGEGDSWRNYDIWGSFSGIFFYDADLQPANAGGCGDVLYDNVSYTDRVIFYWDGVCEYGSSDMHTGGIIIYSNGTIDIINEYHDVTGEEQGVHDGVSTFTESTPGTDDWRFIFDEESGDSLLGNSNNVGTSGVNNLNVTIDGGWDDNPTGMRLVEFKENEITFLEFDFDFDTGVLNMSNISIIKHPYGAYISGLEGISKTFYVPTFIYGVCARNDIGSISDSINCDDVNENLFSNDGCNGTTVSINGDDINCTIQGGYYVVSGLTHSGIEAVNKGTIPMNSGIPFYTISQNPVYPENLSCLDNMQPGEVCNQTWEVNATGDTETAWIFYTLYNSPVSGSNTTNIVNITITGLNVVPTQTTPLLNSTTGYNITSDNLTVYNQSTDDADLDAVKNIINWKLDGASITLLNMPFEGGSNSTWTKDYSGAGNNGTVNGSVWNSTGGHDGRGAYEFDAVDDDIFIDYNPTLGAEPFSIFSWIKTSELGERKQIVAYGNDSTDRGVWLYVNSSNYIQVDLSYSGGPTSNVTVTDGNWHYVGVVFDGTYMQIYVDGVASGWPEGMSPNIAPGEVLIGKELPTGPVQTSWRFNGSIDEVVIYNKTLSAEQISALYDDRTDLIVEQETVKGQTWQACITPNDGQDDGSENCSNTLIIVNAVPTVDSIAVSPSFPNTTNNLNCTYSASDLDFDSLTPTFNWYKNSVSQGIDSQILGSGNTTPQQNWSCSVNVSDGEAYDIENSTNVTILDNVNPIFSNALNVSSDFKRYSNFTANITIDNFALDYYKFSTNASGSWVNRTVDISGAQYNATEQVNISLAQGNSLCWYYWANDSVGNNDFSNTYCFIVQNSAPYFNPALVNQTVAENSNLIYDINCSDTDADSLVYYINDSSKFSINSTSGMINWTPGFSDSGIYWYNATCGDGEANVSGVFNINVTNTNRAPTLDSIAISPSSPDTTIDLNCTYTASDLDLDSLTTIFNWYKNGSSQGINNQILALGNISVGENWSCSLNVSDGSAYDWEMSNNVTIVAAAVCGNNLTETGEDCDGTDLNASDCSVAGTGYTGTLTCTATCTFNTTECSAPSGDDGNGGPGCTPDCSGKECGDDGCSGTCGTCANGESCDSGICVALCNEDWECGEWNDCNPNTLTQIRTCNDNNNCGTEISKPLESQSCTITCNENWQCEWTECIEGDSYSYAYDCVDLNNCGTEAIKPIQETCEQRAEQVAGEGGCNPIWNCDNWQDCDSSYTIEDVLNDNVNSIGVEKRNCIDEAGCKANKVDKRSCSAATLIDAKRVEWCEETYVEIFEKDTNRLVSRVKEKQETLGITPLETVDISLITTEFTGYCDYCFDGMRNYDETGLDCGGASCPVCVEKGFFFDYINWIVMFLWASMAMIAVTRVWMDRQIIMLYINDFGRQKMPLIQLQRRKFIPSKPEAEKGLMLRFRDLFRRKISNEDYAGNLKSESGISSTKSSVEDNAYSSKIVKSYNEQVQEKKQMSLMRRIKEIFTGKPTTVPQKTEKIVRNSSERVREAISRTKDSLKGEGM